MSLLDCFTDRRSIFKIGGLRAYWRQVRESLRLYWRDVA